MCDPVVTILAIDFAIARLNGSLLRDRAIITALAFERRAAIFAYGAVSMSDDAEKDERDGWPK